MHRLLISNANILPFHNAVKAGADTLCIEDNQFKAIGRWEELQSLADNQTTIINAAGKTIMPGFNDTHIHIWKVGQLMTYMLDLRGISSKSEMLEVLLDYAKKNPDNIWLTARGFNEAHWSDKSLPTKTDLDKLGIDRPVYVIRTCAHIAVCNSLALQKAGINNKTISPPGGEIRIGIDGQPNGILTETALGLITKHIPTASGEQLRNMILAAQQELLRLGITAATDPAVDPLLLDTYMQMEAASELRLRINALPILLPDGASRPNPIPKKYESNFFRVNAVKFFSDGGLSGKTAALKKTYKDSTEKGILRLEKDLYTSLATQAMKNELGVATHAIGDDAIDFVIDVYTTLHEAFPHICNRIEHLGLPSRENLAIMYKKKIAASMQSIFIHELGNNFLSYLDETYLKKCYPIRSVVESGILVSLSSDAPVVKNFNPLHGAYAAHSRKTITGERIAPQESVSLSTALSLYTSEAAKMSQIPHYGCIAPGYLADFIMLNQNPLQAANNDVNAIHVTDTFINGKLAWSKAEK
jgi:hypothetical protein